MAGSGFVVLRKTLRASPRNKSAVILWPVGETLYTNLCVRHGQFNEITLIAGKRFNYVYFTFVRPVICQSVMGRDVSNGSRRFRKRRKLDGRLRAKWLQLTRLGFASIVPRISLALKIQRNQLEDRNFLFTRLIYPSCSTRNIDRKSFDFQWIRLMLVQW